MLIRIISALVMGSIGAALILFAPQVMFNVIILLMIAGGLFEFFRLVFGNARFYQRVGIAYSLVVAAACMFAGLEAALITIVAGLFIVALIYMRYSTVLEGLTTRLGLTLLGTVYLGATLPFYPLVRELPHGKALIFMGIAAAAMSDTFALAVGKTIGRRKFAPITSPNKTWEGFIGGFAGSILAVWVVSLIGWRDLPLVHVLALGVIIGFVGPMGDLVESLIKRSYHVKDSGSIIPGHGGVLDRLDALVFVGPVLYLYAKWVL